VEGIDPHKSAYLTLDELTADPQLVRRLPPDLAWRCHALPLVEANGRVTVAMADPEDVEAREAVITALGPKSCVVKGASWTIDAQLAQIWGEAARCPLKLTVCAFPEPLSDELCGYAWALCDLMGAHLDRVSSAGEMNALTGPGARPDCDLLMFGQRRHPLIRRLLSSEGAQASQSSVLPAILVAERPRWPLKRILLVLCGEGADHGAVDWGLRLALPSAAAVTVLAVVPPMPIMYRGLSRMEQSIAALLTTDTALGRQMHRVARRLAEREVNGALRLRQGAPDEQIYREVVEGDHDLVVLAPRPCHWWLRQLKGDPICSLLSQVDRPMLLVAPTTE
jgi:nucleotide-binding universal stress UspA family protein